MTIATRIRLLCVSLVLLSGAMLMWVTWADREAQVLEALRADARSVAIFGARALLGSIRTQQAQAVFLSKTQAISQIVGDPDEPAFRGNVDLGMAEYLRAHRDVFKARLVDGSGDEIFRADQMPSGDVRISAPGDYQNRA